VLLFDHKYRIDGFRPDFTIPVVMENEVGVIDLVRDESVFDKRLAR